jgi:hypothetical protein
VIIKVDVDAGVVLIVLRDRVDVPPAVTEVGVKVAVAPAGRPVTERLIFWGLPMAVVATA